MEIDRLKRVWQQTEPTLKPDTGEEVRQIVARFAAWRRQVRRRDYREHAAAILCIVVFTRLAFVLPSIVARASAVFLVGAAVLAVVKLIRANPGRRQTDRATSVREFCENELRRIDAQIRLLRSVPFWSVGPVLVGVNVMFAALSPRLLWTIVYLVVTLVFGTSVCYVNRRAVDRCLVPLRDDLVRILGDQS